MRGTRSIRQVARLLCAWLACSAAHGAAAEAQIAAPPDFSVLLLPARHESTDPAAREPLETFHALLREQLRAIHGLQLRVGDAASAGDNADYRVTVASHATTPMNTRLEWFNSMTGMSRSSLPPPEMAGEVWPFEVGVEHQGRWVSRGMDFVVFVPRTGSPLPPLCGGPVASNFVAGGLVRAEASANARASFMGSVCQSLAQNAVRVVEAMRMQAFPPDPAIYMEFAAQVGNGSLPELQRMAALNRLVGEQRKGRFSELDGAAAASIARFAAAYPQQRPLAWRSVRGIAHPALVGALLESLRNDVDFDSRLEALTTLAADDAGERRVREAFQAAARDDRHELVRMAARRAQGDAAAWRGYVLETLRKGDLTPAGRLAPLLYAAQPPLSAQQRADLAAMVEDRRVVEQITTLARNWRTDPSVTQRLPIGRALELLVDSKDPAVQALRAEYAGDARQQIVVLPGSEGLPPRQIVLPLPPAGMPRPGGMP